MRRIYTVLAALALSASTLPLASCGVGFNDAPPVSLSGVAADEKALYVAETAFRTISEALNSAVDSGVLKGDDAAKALDLYTKAKTALNLAREAHTAGNASTVMEQSLLAQSLVTQIFGLIH